MWFIKFLPFATILIAVSAQIFEFTRDEIVMSNNDFVTKFLTETMNTTKYQNAKLVAVSPTGLIHSILPVIDLTCEYIDRFDFLESLTYNDIIQKHEFSKFLTDSTMKYESAWFYNDNMKSKVENQLTYTRFPSNAIQQKPVNQLPKELIDQCDLNPRKSETAAFQEYVKDVELIIAGTTIFNATWKYPFHVQSNNIESENPVIVGNFNISKGILWNAKTYAEWIKLPFKNDTTSMYVFKNIRSLKYLGLTLAGMNSDELIGKKELVSVKLPKFTIQHSMELRPILEKMKLGQIFKKRETRRLIVDKFLHLVKFEISEFGAELRSIHNSDILDIDVRFGSDNTYNNKPSTPKPTVIKSRGRRFYVTTPFVFAIFHNPSGLPLLVGHSK